MAGQVNGILCEGCNREYEMDHTLDARTCYIGWGSWSCRGTHCHGSGIKSSLLFKLVIC